MVSSPAKSIGGEILLSGKLESENTANLSTRVMGYITSINVKPGDRVAKGVLLATISSQDMLAKKAQASAMIAEAEAAARNAGKDYARYQTLYKQQSVSAKELETVSLQNTSAQSRLEAARQMRNEVNAMIGFIALAGVMVRNSVLLIDFINIRLKDGIPLKQSIIEAGAVRTTPILLTAGAVALGAVVILFDPIFQGLAISLMGGTITSTLLTLIVVPLLYFKMMRKKYPESQA